VTPEQVENTVAELRDRVAGASGTSIVVGTAQVVTLLAALDAANADAARLAASVAVIPRGESITGMVEIEAALALAAHRARIETQP
jgi:ApbE superfamily uncharacterized protein (UPF0280 family)